MTAEAETSLFAELGGEPALRRIIDTFVDRVFDDIMIGFLFQRANRERIKEKEFEFAAEFLGAPVEYSGRSLEDAHRRHRIFDGQFQRRLTILRNTLDELSAPARVRDALLAHTVSLRARVVAGDCDEPVAAIPGSRPE
ncbi:MAG TPA: group 1 truncated hemoglobin [Polyangiaceae bacterium]|nr:group 1 truncated hemoglobin [Polyangiaceae bacterium]